MGLNTTLAAAMLATMAYWHPCTAREVPLEVAAWPEEQPCAACVTLQFDMLEMRLPTQSIGRIFFSAGESATVQLLPEGALDGRASALFLSATRLAYVGKYQTLGLTSAATMRSEEFFDSLGQPERRDDLWQKIRHIESIDVAEHYVKTSKGPIHAYWIQGPPGNSQYIHFVIDGSDTIYSVVGAVTPQLYRAILNGLVIRPVP